MTKQKATLAERILDCFPSGTYALHALLQLLEVSESRTIETAAVECRIQPRLLVNPDFCRHVGRDSRKASHAHHA